MKPLFDVIIPTHDRADWLEACLVALKNFTQHPIQVFVVDNASKEDETKALFKRIDQGDFSTDLVNVLVIHMAQNKSFSNSVNAGIQAGAAPNIVILNNDALVTPGWDACFLQDLADPKVGLTGARSNAASGLQSDSTGLSHVVQEAKFLVFVCVALRREIYNAVGPLDGETFDGFSCEDLDFSWRVRWGIANGANVKTTLAELRRAAGGTDTEPVLPPSRLKLKISNAYVLHGLSQTLTKVTGDQETRARNDQKYQLRLAEKWGMEVLQASYQLKPKVFVATFSAEEWTRVEFLKQVCGLRRGTSFEFDYMHVTRLPIHAARNAVAKTALQHGFDYLLMVDDDMVFPPDTLHRLMAHDKDVVCAMAYGRRPPYGTCVYALADDKKHGVAMEGIEHTGLRKVDISGFAVSLVKLDVFRKLKAKGVEEFFSWSAGMGEDFHFSKLLREAEIPLYVDTDFIVGHIGENVVVNEAVKKAYTGQR